MIAHGVNNHGGKRANEMGRKNHRLRLESVALGRSCYCLLISVVQLEANRQADVLVDTLHCKTEQYRACAQTPRQPLRITRGGWRPFIIRFIVCVHWSAKLFLCRRVAKWIEREYPSNSMLTP